ncbi:hypothetical protein ACFX1Q_030647 [Malus domestica]|uniref:zinc finger protein CONSTANS-LIKE 2-like n=1 Tax=Malus domestica TaxID=3750 RepID=UPI0039754B1B
MGLGGGPSERSGLNWWPESLRPHDPNGAFATLELLLTAAADVVEKKLTTSKELRVQENERRRKVRDCELCGVWARVHCEPDQARLCWDYDKKVHEANFLVVKHQRSLICRRCQSLTPWTGSGPKLTPTVSVCEISIEHRESKFEQCALVVSWLVDPPPAASCSSSEEEEKEEEFSVSKRMRENADLGCDETEAFDWLRMLKRQRLGGENRLQSKRSTAMGSSKSRGLIMETEAINEDDDHDESR